MLIKPSLDQLLPHTENSYTLAILVAKRARQLIEGALPMIESHTPNRVTLSCEEVAESTVVAVPGQHTPFVPLHPDVIARLEEEKRAKEDSGRLEILQGMANKDTKVAETKQESSIIDLQMFSDALEQASLEYAEKEAAQANQSEDEAVSEEQAEDTEA